MKIRNFLKEYWPYSPIVSVTVLTTSAIVWWIIHLNVLFDQLQKNQAAAFEFPSATLSNSLSRITYVSINNHTMALVLIVVCGYVMLLMAQLLALEILRGRK